MYLTMLWNQVKMLIVHFLLYMKIKRKIRSRSCPKILWEIKKSRLVLSHTKNPISPIPTSLLMWFLPSQYLTVITLQTCSLWWKAVSDKQIYKFVQSWTFHVTESTLHPTCFSVTRVSSWSAWYVMSWECSCNRDMSRYVTMSRVTSRRDERGASGSRHTTVSHTVPSRNLRSSQRSPHSARNFADWDITQ